MKERERDTHTDRHTGSRTGGGGGKRTEISTDSQRERKQIEREGGDRLRENILASFSC